MSQEHKTAATTEMAGEEKQYPVQQSMAFSGTTFATFGLIDLLAHFGPTGLVLAGMAAYVAYRHGPEVAEQVRGIFPPTAQEEEMVVDQEPETPQKRAPKRSVLDWAFSLPSSKEEGDQEQAAAS